MNRSETYASIVKDISARLRISGFIQSDDDLKDINDNADDGNFAGILNNATNKDIFSGIVDKITDWDGSEASISCGRNFYICDVQQDNKHYFKHIQVHDDNARFVCVSVNNLKNFQNSIEDQDMRLIERIWTSIESNTTHKDNFWNLVRNGGDNKYILVTDESPVDEESKWRLYCFGYLLYCNSNKFQKPSELGFIPQTSFQTSVSLNPTAKYEQFFDVYDLMNEAHYCDDILSRYLNMYHIIESMCYRRHLAKISKGDTKRNAYVRRALKQFGRGSKNESDEIPEGIVKLFPNLETMFPGSDFTPDNKRFLKDEYNIDFTTNPTKKQIANIIYQLRNSIAHNKATELHFSFSNTAEYTKIIDLIKNVITKLEPAIVDLISINPTPGEDHPLEYDKREFEIY